jgi:hypothetical protein
MVRIGSFTLIRSPVLSGGSTIRTILESGMKLFWNPRVAIGFVVGVMLAASPACSLRTM